MGKIELSIFPIELSIFPKHHAKAESLKPRKKKARRRRFLPRIIMPKEGDPEPSYPVRVFRDGEDGKWWKGLEYLKMGRLDIEEIACKLRQVVVPYSEDELLRLFVLHSSRFLERDPDLETALLRYSSMAATVFNCPVAYASFVDVDKQQLLARINLDEHTFNWRNESVCTHTILSDAPDVLVVPDLSKDERFCNLAVHKLAGINFYCGTPLKVDGYRIGSVCVMGVVPRQVSLQEMRIMLDIGEAASAMLQLKRKYDVYREDKIMRRLERQMHCLRTPLQAMVLAAGQHENLDADIRDGLAEISSVVSRSSLLCKVLMQRLQPAGELCSLSRMLEQLALTYPRSHGVNFRLARGVAQLPDLTSYSTILEYILLSSLNAAKAKWGRAVVFVSLSLLGCPETPGSEGKTVEARLSKEHPPSAFTPYFINIRIATSQPVSPGPDKALSQATDDLASADAEDFQSLLPLIREIGGKVYSTHAQGREEHCFSFPALVPASLSTGDFVALQGEEWDDDEVDGEDVATAKPVAVVAAAPTPIVVVVAPTSPQQQQQQSSLHVLVVEDSPSVQKVMSKFLTSRGCTVAVANNGKEGLGQLGEVGSRSFDVAFVDYLMPLMLGNEMMVAVKAAINANPATHPAKNTLFVGMSATGAGTEAESMGADSAQHLFLEKPLPPRSIDAILAAVRSSSQGGVEAVAHHLGSTLLRREASAPSPSPSPSPSSVTKASEAAAEPAPKTFLKPSKVHPEAHPEE